MRKSAKEALENSAYLMKANALKKIKGVKKLPDMYGHERTH